jgi:predicted dehydrogenase
MRRLIPSIALLLLCAFAPASGQPAPAPAPLRVGMAGLVHGHASGFLARYLKRPDLELVGIAEPDTAVAAKYQQRFALDPSRLFTSLDEMLDRTRPEAVVVFTDTFDHLRVVEACAARRIPVMMEKPLAVSVEHARAIERVAAGADIPVLVNYETTWYASNRAAWTIVKEQKALGDIRKVVVHDGHPGPKAINVQPEFFAWLTDPVRNGAGALFDFGCYGANLLTWLMDGARPIAVTAVTQRFQPDVYRNVDDEATILVEYPSAQGIIQASWNWPFDRKDMEIYGQRGQVFAGRLDALRVRMPGQQEVQSAAPPIPAPEDDFVRYLAAVVRSEIKPAGLSSLENNLVVTEILDAARRSAASGTRIVFK